MKKFTEFLMNSTDTAKKTDVITVEKNSGSKRKHHLMYVNVGGAIVTLYD